MGHRDQLLYKIRTGTELGLSLEEFLGLSLAVQGIAGKPGL